MWVGNTWRWLLVVSAPSHHWSVLILLSPVSYVFRTLGQVLGVALSGAILQAILQKELSARITGKGAEKVRVARPNQVLFAESACRLSLRSDSHQPRWLTYQTI